MTGPVASLYIHVPFCARKCSYCAFYSEAADASLMDRYVRALLRELERVAPDLRPQTIFFGGGTPTLLTLRHWEQIFRAMERLNLLGAAEFTVEANPATLSADKARLLRAHGVNRISLGVQTLDPALLDRLGRIHTPEQVFRSYDLLRRAGFDNVNLDLMFGIPGQTMSSWKGTLREALALQSEHLSCYEVIYEEDTPLFAQLQAGAFAVDEDLICAQYDRLLERTADAGFHQYEVANFARNHRGSAGCAGPLSTEFPAYACRHNINYWRGGDFYGLGPSAVSYVRGVRTRNLAHTPAWCEALEQGGRALAWREALPPLARAGETAAFGLRVVAGWPYAEFRSRTGYDLREEWAAELEELERRGWGVREPDRFRLTPTGLRFADAAAEMMLRPAADASPGASEPAPFWAAAP
ncbi:radical SAM family heme chaperone HemW [Limisphaera sp. VF-2]|uniref:radical SAM family heme chaperone HemW n=1 Tax=Limisphaera sp. VF-2 TaxID=3400418 RepID=UPI003C14F968